MARRPAKGWFGAPARQVRAWLRSHARRAMRRFCIVLLRRRFIVPAGRGSWCWRWAARCSCSSAATSSRSSTAARSSCTCARPAGTRIEKTEQIFQAVEDKIREVIPERRARPHRRQYRLAGALLQFRVRRRHRDRRQRRRHPGRAEGRPRADGELCREAAPGAAGGVPGGHLLLPGRRHGDPDPQLRHPGADRRPHRRLRPREEPAQSPRSCSSGSRRSRGSPTCICSRRSTRRSCSLRSTARAPPSSVSPPTASRSTSTPA